MISGFQGEYSFLSNFDPSPFQAQGADWPTVEHYYQAMKTTDPAIRATIAGVPTPGRAKRHGRRVELRPDWEAIKLAVMRQGLACKFPLPDGLEWFASEGEPLGGRLIRTAPHELVEFNTWGDQFWGVTDRGGRNWLGHLLMARRAELIAASVR